MTTLTPGNNYSVTWHRVSELPDDDTTVLLFDQDQSEPVWPGYRSEGGWRYAEGNRAYPTHWAHFPEGPAEE